MLLEMTASTVDKVTAIPEEPNHEQESKCSEKAITFLTNIEPAELQKCVFSETLAQENRNQPGMINISVQFSSRGPEPCMMLMAERHVVSDDEPQGRLTALINVELEILEENYHEYTKDENHSIDKKYHLEQRDGQMMISKVTTIGGEVTREDAQYPMSLVRGLVTEGSNLLLMRVFALRKKVPTDIVFLGLDQHLHIVQNTYSELDLKRQEIDGEVQELFGVQRVLHLLDGHTITWECYFQDNGHLASRTQVGSPFTLSVLEEPSQTEESCEKASLTWEEDIQMSSEFLERREELKADHAVYLREHPEIRALLSDFLQFLLLRKPEDVYQFAKEYFLPFASGHLREQS